jgi:hypothetical protein
MYHLMLGGLNSHEVPDEFRWEGGLTDERNAVWYRLLLVEQMEKHAMRDLIEIDV